MSTETQQTALEHLNIIEQSLGQLKGGIECSMMIPPSGAIIHKDHSLEVIQRAAISVRACRDLLDHPEEQQTTTLHQELTALHKKALELSQGLESIGERHTELLNNYRVWTIRQTLDMVPGAIEGLAEEVEREGKQ